MKYSYGIVSPSAHEKIQHMEHRIGNQYEFMVLKELAVDFSQMEKTLTTLAPRALDIKYFNSPMAYENTYGLCNHE